MCRKLHTFVRIARYADVNENTGAFNVFNLWLFLITIPAASARLVVLHLYASGGPSGGAEMFKSSRELLTSHLFKTHSNQIEDTVKLVDMQVTNSSATDAQLTYLQNSHSVEERTACWLAAHCCPNSIENELPGITQNSVGSVNKCW